MDIGYDHNPAARDALVGIVNSTSAFLSYRDQRRRRNKAANRKMGAACFSPGPWRRKLPRNWTRPRDREDAGPHQIGIIVQEKAAALSITERKSAPLPCRC